jgi:hypothetical protein
MAGGLSGFHHLKARIEAKTSQVYHTQAYGVFHHVFKVKNLVPPETRAVGYANPKLQ